MSSPRPPVLPPARSWEVMAALREALGLAGMQCIFSVGHNQIGRYCRNPDISDDAERNPLDRVRLLLARGVEAGAEEAVRMAVGYLLEPLGMKAVPVGEAPPDRETCEANAWTTTLRCYGCTKRYEHWKAGTRRIRARSRPSWKTTCANANRRAPSIARSGCGCMGMRHRDCPHFRKAKSPEGLGRCPRGWAWGNRPCRGQCPERHSAAGREAIACGETVRDVLCIASTGSGSPSCDVQE